MCAIAGWCGHLPMGVLSKMILAARSRGTDSFGLAFRGLDNNRVPLNFSWRSPIDPADFVKNYQHILSDARRGPIGIFHARRASAGMPIDTNNAHPFLWGKHLYAHNGFISNWEDLRQLYLDEYKDCLASADPGLVKMAREWVMARKLAQEPLKDPAVNRVAELVICERLLREAETDSVVLGPSVESRDFSSVAGSLGLVWICRDKVFVVRSAKEVAAATIIWRKDTADNFKLVTIVASTPRIIVAGVKILERDGYEYGITPTELIDENVIFEVQADGLRPIRRISTLSPTENNFTSEEYVPCAEASEEK